MLICFAAPIDADFYNNRRFDMQPTLCSRCHKNVAVVFITKMENGQAKNEGLCLKCARELHIKPVDDVINKMGLTDEELDGLTNEMMEAMGGPEALSDIDNSDSDSDDDGKTATFPFLNRLFGAGGAVSYTHLLFRLRPGGLRGRERPRLCAGKGHADCRHHRV